MVLSRGRGGARASRDEPARHVPPRPTSSCSAAGGKVENNILTQREGAGAGGYLVSRLAASVACSLIREGYVLRHGTRSFLSAPQRTACVI